MGDTTFTYQGFSYCCGFVYELGKTACFDMSKNVCSHVMCIKCLSDQGTAGLLLNLDLYEKETICSKKNIKHPAE